MHAYRDAIRRTSGAYVLYPGNQNKELIGFHEILPGLGAFAVSPKQGINETQYLEKFLQKILSHFLNRASQRENIAAKTYQITKDGKSETLKESIPEYINDEKLIPDETYVLVGFYNSPEQYKWITKNKKYNFRMGSGNGSLVLDEETVKANYLLLHTHKEKSSGDLWKIKSKGPKVYSKANMIKNGYPNPSQDYYLVIDIEKINPSEFKNVKWDFRNLQKYNSKHASAKPSTTSLSELMRNKFKLP